MSERAGDSEALERYLDGQLSNAERAAFERRLAEEAALREALGLQASVDRALGRLFGREVAAGAADRALAAARRELAAPRARRGWLRTWYAAAAGLLLAGAAVWAGLAWWIDYRRTPLERVYHDVVAAGFEPKIVCTTDEQFVGWMYSRFGHPLVIEDRPADLELVGWDYAKTLSAYTGLLLARVGGEEVLVVIDFLKIDQPQPAPTDESLHVFRREVGGLVMYEVTPREAPAIVDRLVRVEPPRDPGS